MQTQLLIEGKLVAGEGEKQPVYNPATGELLLEIAEASAAQVDAAVQAADRAFVEWGQTTPKTRAECLLKLADASGLVIIEDDIFSDFENVPAPRLAAYDGLERVIHIGSFSKTLSACGIGELGDLHGR